MLLARFVIMAGGLRAIECWTTAVRGLADVALG
jgi:hypothetical protein